MTNFARMSRAVTAMVAALAIVACGPTGGDDAAVGEGQLLIRGAGATFPEPLYAEWIARYTETHPDVVFRYEGVGSGTGIKRFIAEEVDFGASDAAMSDDEIAAVSRGVKLVPATAGMVVLAYNITGVGPGLRLPRDVYADIFLNKITHWDDARIAAANPDVSLPHKQIQAVVRRDSSGTTFAFTNHLSSISREWQSGAGAAKLLDWPGSAITGSGNEGVAQKVNISEGSIGYMEYGFARRLGLPMAALENQAGEFVLPSADTGREALANAAGQLPDNLRLFLPDPAGTDSYPIVSLSWIMLYGDYPEAGKGQAIREALTAGLTDGQAVAEEMGYIPLPDPIADRAIRMVASVQ